MVVRRPKYEPIGDVLSAETAFIQASTALDIAAMLAVESKDAEQLRRTAEQYIELGSRLMNPGPAGEDDEEEHDLSSQGGFGFAAMPDKEVQDGGIDGDDGNAAKAQGRRVAWLHTKYGKL